MPYDADINRRTPGAFLFLIDQSGSMDELVEVTGNSVPLDVPHVVDGVTYTHTCDGVSKAECLADVINRTLHDLVSRCTRHEGCRHYFDVGVIGYGAARVATALHGGLGERILQPLPLFEERTLRVEERPRRGGNGQMERFPVWVEPRAEGETPMCRGIELAIDAVERWCLDHPDSHPPVVVNVSDGQSSDGDPEGPAERLRATGTNDGSTLLFNLFLEPTAIDPILFPVRQQDLPGRHAKALFRMSSIIPERMRRQASERGCEITPGARMFGYKAGISALIKCFDMATRPAQLR